jgi:hypothetical protein
VGMNQSNKLWDGVRGQRSEPDAIHPTSIFF